MKKHAVTILLLVIAAGLAVFLWRDRDRVTDGERARREGSVFGAWRGEQLSRVELTLTDESIVLERDLAKDSPWRMVSPRKEPADQASVERLLIALEFAQEARKATPGPELGLDAPRARGTLTMGGLVIRFALGAPSPRPEGSAYMQVDGQAPVVVSKDFAETLLQASDAYRDRTVVPYLSLDLARFESRPKGLPGFTLEHTEARSFRVVGSGVRASRAALDRVWGSLAEMRAEQFPKDVDAEKLLGEPEVVLVMTPKDGSKPTAELALGGSCPGHPAEIVVVRRRPSPLVACAPRTVLPGFRMGADVLVDRGAFTFHADEIEELRLERLHGPDAGAAPRVIEIARRGTGFHLREPDDRDLSTEESDAANDLVAALVEAQAESAKAGDAGTQALEAEVRVTARSGERQQVLELGALSGGAVRAKRVADGAELSFDAHTAALFAPRATAIVPRRVVRDARPVKRVLARCGVPQDIADTGAGFALVEPRGFDVDATAVTQLVDALTRGKIDRWLADRDDGSFGIDPGASGCHLTLGLEGGATITVRLGEVGSHGVYGNVSDGGYVFVAPASFRALAQTLFVSRAYTRVDELVTGLRVETRAGARRVDPVSEGTREALASLSADDVRALGPPPAWAGAPAIKLVVSVARDGGAAQRVISFADVDAGAREARVDGVGATFVVSDKKVERVLGPADAGDGAPDAGLDAAGKRP
ncbi:MAG: DUF4340 domain-containing protein [Myxococcales bacterium]|nr:DUF4340 domain-containing protein [Myxococcales bacterium]